ncbi:MAG TPA: hypothetical protein VF088_09450 [Pyrinomonadaceae bacterium]
MPFQSGEFKIPNSVSGRTKAAAVFNNTLYLLDLYPGYNTQITFDLTKLKKQSSSPIGDEPIDPQALTNPANWIAQSLSLPSTLATPTLVSFAGAMYCFLNSEGQLLASEFSLSNDSSAPGGWSHPITLLESDKKTAPLGQSAFIDADVSATTVADNIVIVAMACTTSPTHPTPATFVAVYDTRDIDTSTNKWAAKWHDYLPLDSMDRSTPIRASVEWFAAIMPDSKDTDPPKLRLAVFVQPQLNLDNPLPLRMSYYTMTVGQTAGSEISVTLTMDQSNLHSGHFHSNLVRDPAGRLRSWIRPAHQRTEYDAVLLHVTPEADIQFSPSGESITVKADPIPTTPPCSLFYLFSDGQSETTVNGKSAIQYPVYEFVFYGTQGMAQVNRCGTVQVVPDFSVRQTSEDFKKPLNIITGIIDGPIPIPLENYRNYDPGPGQTNAGSMVYGIQKSEGSSHQVSNTVSGGIESQGKVTKGIGAAWDISFKAGGGWVTGDSSGTTISYDLLVKAIISTALGNNNPSIVPDGALRSVGAQFSITAFVYLDNFGPNVDSTTNAPTDGLKAATVTMSMVDETVLNYTPYMVTPGKLESYTPEAINATMKSLGYTDTENYFGDVITQNAYPFSDYKNPYLEYSWGKDGGLGEGFSEWTASFQESSWHLDVHAWGGISGGAGATIFGVGEDLEYEVMAGIDYSHNSISDSDKKSGWSIGLADIWGPPTRDLPDSVSAYRFRVYLLPVPVAPSKLAKTRWTTELISHTNRTDLDGNSACWRIVYVVTLIQHLDGSSPYEYDGHLDVPSVYTTANQ